MSLYLDGLASTRASKRWLRCLGVACIPMCCAGCICLQVTQNSSRLIALSPSIIAFYGGRAGVEAMAAAVRREQELFLRAIDAVRSGSTTVKIFPGVALIDCAIHADASGNLARAVKSSWWRRHSAADDEDKDAYIAALHAQYVRLGGDPRRIVYGFPEYVLLTERSMAFDSDAFTSVCEAFADPASPLAQLARDSSSS